MRMSRWVGPAVLGAVLAGVLVPSEALACGGFFCSRVPVDQSGENIVFGVHGRRVEAHVQIQYQGEAEKFAWVVPVPSLPGLSIGSPALFTFLAQATQPQFQLEWTRTCTSFQWPWMDVANESASPGSRGADGGVEPGVVVVSQEEVGPFDAAILQATDAQALRTWLVDNGYDLTSVGSDLLEPYVGTDAYFVALKLQKDRDVGDLRPIVLTMEDAAPGIPIRLTAVAARPDMPIRAYVLAEKRAVPVNYRHVLLNPTRVDWLNGGANYAALASGAVDEAGGHAFLTEFAGPSAPLAAGFGRGSFDTAALARLTHPVDFMRGIMQQSFPSDGTLLALLRRYIPLPQALRSNGVTEQSFYNFMEQFRADIDSDPGRAAFDAAGFAAELEESIVEPLARADALLDAHPYLTRLFTTMSAAEMTKDPEFDSNPDAPDVSNIHRAKASEESCEADFSQRRIRIELPDGTFFLTRRADGPLTTGPGALRVEQFSNTGGPTVLQDNAAGMAAAVRAVGGGVGGEGCGGCTSAALGPTLAGLLLGLQALRRRRNQGAVRG
ncbi:MAG: DUF2330 domain-containing protein [Myxococcaceae bacterium]|nr:DUF2330 domain-containing protein [Myxococcaceae bacterium]MCI0669906.1 DUF2330 domain-containing protein [Myxococcaceae bacterium]